MTLIVTGFNHKKAPITVLEKAALPKESMRPALLELMHNPYIDAVALLATCNRFEIYADINDPQGSSVLISWLIENTACLREEFHQHGFSLTEQHAAQHLARVSCSLEAMMVGETQILNQVKQAYQLAQEANTLNKNLTRLFENTLSISKQVRHETDITKHPVSFVTTAAKISYQIFESLDSKYALMVGTGEIMQLAIKHFSEKGLKHITVSGRSEQNMFDLAVQYFADSLPLERIATELHQFDIVISGTASLKPIITHHAVQAALKKRKHRPIFMVDLALPRDIEGSVSKLEDVYLYTLESLANISDKNHALRLQAAEEAKSIIDQRVKKHFAWIQENSANDAIKIMRDRAEQIRQETLQKALKLIANGTPPEEALEFLATLLTNKLTHPPTQFLKEIVNDNDRTVLKTIPKNAATMKPSLLNKLQKMSMRFEEINTQLGQAETLKNQNSLRTLGRERTQLQDLISHYKQYLSNRAELDSTREILKDSDSEIKALAQEEIEALKKSNAEIEDTIKHLLIPTDPHDDDNIFLEIRAGTGGDEAAIFAGDLFRMYSRYADLHHWKVEVISVNEGEHGGYKEIIARIEGKGAYARLKYEAGTHRVQRVPETESQGRIHTSASTIAVLPEAQEIDEISIDSSDLRIDTFRASGAGGQHVNKTDSAIRITHLPTGTAVECQEDRSQHRNKARAMALLKARLLDLERSKQNSEQAEIRRNMVGSGDRSERIRTYNFPQGRITDHRIGLTLYQLTQLLEGDVDMLVTPLINEQQAKLLTHLEESDEV